MTEYVSTEELAERWRTTAAGVLMQRHRGALPAALRVGRRVLWRLEDIEAWEQERRNCDPRPAA
jgi:predicted DNA-binding transcriptional regulator AlpA